MKRIHIVGRKNSGKTTLIVELVQKLTARGHRVGTIKHTHHSHELDTPGKDSHRHRKAGSSAVGILSSDMNAIFWPRQGPATVDAYAQFDAMMSQCDVVLVEGDQKSNATRIEVYRSINVEPPLVMSDETLHAVVTDDPLDTSVPIWKRSDPDSVVQEIEALMNSGQDR